MAARQIDDHLTCPICLDRFKQPKILPCGHTICHDPCLRGLMQNRRVLCPVCRTTHFVRDEVNPFPDNFALAGLLDIPTQDTAPVAAPSPPPQSQPQIHAQCQDCRKKNIEGECNHCDKILCRDCLVKHSGILSSELQKSLQQMKTHIPKFEHRISELNKRQGEIKLEGEGVEAEIIQWHDRCVTELHNKTRKMLGEIKSSVTKVLERFQSEQESTGMDFTLAKSFHENAEAKIKEYAKCEENTLSLRQQQNDLVQMIKLSKEFATKISLTTADVESGIRKIPKFNERSGQTLLTTISNLQALVFATRREENIADELTSGLRRLTFVASDALLYRSKGQAKICFGRQGSDVGCLKRPCGIAATPDGNIAVTDTGNDRIQIFDTFGESIRTFGSKGNGHGQFNLPMGLCIADSGEIVVTDYKNHGVQVFSSEGRFIREFENARPGRLNFPNSVAVNENNEVFVGDCTTKIKVFSLNGVFIRSFGESWLESDDYKHLAVAPDGMVIVAENQRHRIGAFDQSGQLMWEKGTNGQGDGQFKEPCEVACDQQGNIIVADSENHRIQIFDKYGNFITTFGSYGSEPRQMNSPIGVAVLRNGDIAVADFGNHRIQIF